jgi:predicted nucleic acid-binding protein
VRTGRVFHSLARLERDGAVDAAAAGAFERLKQVAAGWHEVDASDAVREAAVRFLPVHPLRTADALQLAAAFVAAERRPSSLELVTLDDRLATAARKEGFMVIDVPSADLAVSKQARSVLRATGLGR